ncbi:hypothetical protein BHE74_00007503 [Ensete ventricosum]|nr:hypothetical protein BHE74_00007503 [Ensete ventricosum]
MGVETSASSGQPTPLAMSLRTFLTRDEPDRATEGHPVCISGHQEPNRGMAGRGGPQYSLSRMMRGNPQTGGGRPGVASSVLASTAPPPPAPCAKSGSTSKVQEIPDEEATRRSSGGEARGGTKIPRKRRAEDLTGQRKRDRRKSPHKADRSAAKGKGSIDTAEEPPASRQKLKLVRELYNASVGVDGQDYHAIRMCNLPEQAPDVPLDVDLTIGQLAEIAYRLAESQLRSARTQVCEMETELVELTQSKDALRVDLPRRIIEDYKKSPGFEIDLVRMGRVSLEYGYQLAQARLQARHLGVEIELDPFTPLPEDDDVPMADEQPFDDFLPPPEE